MSKGYEMYSMSNRVNNCVTSFLFIYLLSFSRAAPTAYGGSQARGPIKAVADDLHKSHSNSGSEQCLQPTAQLTAMPDP